MILCIIDIILCFDSIYYLIYDLICEDRYVKIKWCGMKELLTQLVYKLII